MQKESRLSVDIAAEDSKTIIAEWVDGKLVNTYPPSEYDVVQAAISQLSGLTTKEPIMLVTKEDRNRMRLIGINYSKLFDYRSYNEHTKATNLIKRLYNT